MEDRTYKKADGTEKTFKVPKTGSVNDDLSKNLDNTKEEWLKEGCILIKKPTAKTMEEVPLSSVVRYITSDGKARRGGVLISKADAYFRLLNYRSKLSWSVQYEKTDEVYYRRKKGQGYFKQAEKK